VPACSTLISVAASRSPAALRHQDPLTNYRFGVSTNPLPETQLPAGRYPAATTTVWMVSILVLVTEAVLAFGIPGR
jgi:hypothetical protein